MRSVWSGLVMMVLLAGCEGEARPQRAKTSASDNTSASTRVTPSAATSTVTSAAAEAQSDGLIEIDGPGLIAAMRASGKKGTLLNVWASWCGSCKRELPMLVDLGKALESEGVGVVFVSVDKPEARKDAVALLAGLTPRPESFIVRGSLGPFKRAVNPGWKGALPATALFDAQGELVWFWPGPVLEHEITNIVTPFLAGEPLEGPVLVEPGARPQ